MGAKGKPANPESIRKGVETKRARGIPHWTDEQREALSQKMKGMKLTEEHKQKIREALANKPFTKEHREHLSAIKKGKSPNGEQHKNLITKYIDDYKRDGYTCIRIDSRPLPDFIALKEGRAFAIEVEGGSIKPSKYLCPNDYADVIWIQFRRVKYGK